MFSSRRKPKTSFGIALAMFEVVYHSIVRSIRNQHNNAFVAMALNMLQVLTFVLAFYLMFSFLGLRGAALRGDFLLYIMTGIFLYMTHAKTMGSVVNSEGPASPMMQHAPLNTIVSILSAAFGALYIQVFTMLAILFVYHVAFTPVYIDNPAGAFSMLLIAWFAGLGLGLVLLSLKPWFPEAVKIFTTIYQRVNMIASGKMFVANTLPTYMLNMFDWNPLFHTIDQTRGFTFINYYPRNSSIDYPLIVGGVLIVIGLMGEFYTRRHASASWFARR